MIILSVFVCFSVPERGGIQECSRRGQDRPVYSGDKDWTAESWGDERGVYTGKHTHTHLYAHATSALHWQPHICMHTVGGNILVPLYFTRF